MVSDRGRQEMKEVIEQARVGVVVPNKRERERVCGKVK